MHIREQKEVNREPHYEGMAQSGVVEHRNKQQTNTKNIWEVLRGMYT